MPAAEEVSCGCFGTIPKQPYVQKSRFIQDISASIAINTASKQPSQQHDPQQENDPLSGHYSWLIELRRDLPSTQAYVEAQFPDPHNPKGTPYRVPMIPLKNDPSDAYSIHSFNRSLHHVYINVLVVVVIRIRRDYMRFRRG